jgi:Tol biopolymer transport system component
LGAFGAPDDSNNPLFPELSPDSKRAAFSRGPAGLFNIWLQEGTRTSRFTFAPANELYAIWSPDGARIVFASNRTGTYNLYQKLANGSASEEVLLQSAEAEFPDSWSPDGRFIFFYSARNKGDLMVLPLTGDQKPFSFLSTPFDEQEGVFSPDGRWAAYQSDESGRFEIYVRPFPGPGGQWQISQAGGTSPRWRADGKELYFLAPDGTLMAVSATVQGATLTPGTPEALFQTHVTRGNNRQQYDVARDRRFLINTDLESASTEPIHLLLNWRPPAK